MASFLISRRNLLKGAMTLLSGSILARLPDWLPLPAAMSQTAPKRIYLAPDDHTDYFWSAGEDSYHQAFVEMIDYYLNLADSTATEPADHQSRWNCDGSFWLWVYEKNKPAADFLRLINRISSGHISVPLNALCVCLGGAPAEAVLRGMYYPGQIERRYNLRFRLAYLIENQTHPYGISALWAGAGAKYSWKGICNCDTMVAEAGNRKHEIYWAAGPDDSRVLMKWNSLTDMGGITIPHQGLGGYAEARNPAAVVDYVDTDAGFIARYPYRVIGAFGKGWDDFKTLTDEFVTVAKSKTNAARRVIVSNEQDFFEDFEASYSGVIPTYACSFGNEWDLYCAALAEVSARIKRAVETLRNAEALATLVGLQNPAFFDGRQAARDLAWMDLGLFWEHNFGMVGPPSGLIAERVAWQKRLATEIEAYIEGLHTDAAAALAGLIKSSGANPRFYAFNALSWSRTAIADFPYAGAEAVHVIDLSTGQETPSQVVTLAGQPYVRVLAENVPAAGYKVFEIRLGPGKTLGGGPTANAATGLIQNSLYEITVAPRGAITSLKDKSQASRQFAQEINGFAINDLGPGAGLLTVENAGPVSVTLRADAVGPLNHTTRVTLVRSAQAIDIRNELTQNFSDTHAWRFSFNLSNPDVWHEEVGAVIRARLLTQGGHYSERPENSRYDWLTLNHFADMSGATGSGATLSNADCYFMKLGNSTESNLDILTPQLAALAGGRVAHGSNGLPDQGGDTYFLQRFALRTHAGYSPVEAMKFALEHQNPLVTGPVTGGAVYPETSYSCLSIDNPNVLLWAFKPADDGIEQGLIARVWNLSAAPATFSLALEPFDITYARHTSHIETPLGSASLDAGALTETLAPHQLKTFNLTSLQLKDEAFLPLIIKE